MFDDHLAYLIILAAIGLAMRFIRRQIRPGADVRCGCGDCSGCARGDCSSRDAETAFKIDPHRS